MKFTLKKRTTDFETRDLGEAAYITAHLDWPNIQKRSGPAWFTWKDSASAQRLSQAYHAGGTVEAKQYSKTIRGLKDLLFATGRGTARQSIDGT